MCIQKRTELDRYIIYGAVTVQNKKQTSKTKKPNKKHTKTPKTQNPQQKNQQDKTQTRHGWWSAGQLIEAWNVLEKMNIVSAKRLANRKARTEPGPEHKQPHITCHHRGRELFGVPSQTSVLVVGDRGPAQDNPETVRRPCCAALFQSNFCIPSQHPNFPGATCQHYECPVASFFDACIQLSPRYQTPVEIYAETNSCNQTTGGPYLPL